MKILSFFIVVAVAISACGNKTQPAPSHTESTTTPQPQPTPAANAFTENIEFMSFVKDSLTNAASLQALLDNKAASKNICGFPSEQEFVMDCGEAAKYETNDTIFVLVSDIPSSSTSRTEILLKMSPSGKKFSEEETFTATATE